MRATTRNLFTATLVWLLFAAFTTCWSDENTQQTGSNQPAVSNQQPESQDDSVQTDIDGTVSVWGTDVEKDSSKAEEYGEVPHGFLVNSLNADVLMKDDRFLNVHARNVGLNNGRYGFDYGLSGRYALYIDYTKIPHLFSKAGETIWTETAPGVWTLPDAVQGAIQNLNPFPITDPNYLLGLAAQRTFISNLLLDARPQFLGLQRNRGTVGFEYSPGVTWKYGVQYFRENRDGYRPYGTTFGFNWATELPEHIDYNTDRVRTGVEYARKGKSLAVAYEFSGFNNALSSMIWDNPLRLTDRAESTSGDASSRGRVQLPADNHSHLFSISAATPIGRGKVTGAFSYNTLRDEVQLLPYTINSALPQVALPASTFHGNLRNLNFDFRYYTPVGRKGIFTANYRLYDQSNKNDELLFTAFSPLDSSVTLEEEFNPLIAYKTNTADLDYQYSLTKSVRWLAGYSFNRWNRDERDTDQTDTNTLRTGIDFLMSDRLTLHTRYQYDRRRSDTFDLDNPTFLVIPLRRFDVANLNRNVFRINADVTLNAKANLGLNASLQNNDYPDTLYGLQQLRYYTAGLDFSYALPHNSTFNVWYEHAQNTSDQTGRQSGSTPSTSTTFDWAANLKDTFETVGVGYGMTFDRSKWNWNSDFIYADANGISDLTGGVSIRPTGAVDIPDADDTKHFGARTGVSVKAFKHTKFAVSYWFDHYEINDFAEDAIRTDLITVVVPTPLGPQLSVPGVILLNARQPGYTYHSGWIALIYSW